MKIKSDRLNANIDTLNRILELQKSEPQQYSWTSLDEVCVGQKNTEPLDIKRRPSPNVIIVFYNKFQYFFLVL